MPAGNREGARASCGREGSLGVWDFSKSPGFIPKDPNGNLTSDGTKTYQWDAENRLVNVLQGATTLASFTYDGDGRRVTKTVGGVTHSYVYEGPTIAEERLSTGQTYDYVDGSMDRHLAMRDQSGNISYYLADHLGSIAETTNSGGSVSLTRQYDSWGNMLQGATTDGYAFTGREWDGETNLYYYRARYYSSTAGRFISEDPLPQAGYSQYAYVQNNPTDYTDPSGEVVVEHCVHASSTHWAGWGPTAAHHTPGLSPPTPGMAWMFNLIYFSGGCAFRQQGVTSRSLPSMRMSK
jgi:RHS repeat-associated protein